MGVVAGILLWTQKVLLETRQLFLVALMVIYQVSFIKLSFVEIKTSLSQRFQIFDLIFSF